MAVTYNLTDDEKDWKMYANCKGLPEIFSDSSSKQLSKKDRARINTICGNCPVISYCAREVIEQWDMGYKSHGVWAGEVLVGYFFSNKKKHWTTTETMKENRRNFWNKLHNLALLRPMKRDAA